MEFTYEFHTSLRYEIFYALQLITDHSSRIHDEWKRKVINELPDTFMKKLNQFGFDSAFWPVLADIVKSSALTENFDDLTDSIREISAADMQKNILTGVLHYSQIAESIINKEFDLETAIKKMPKIKNEWLAYIGLYPYDKATPINRSMELLINNPEDFRNIIIDLLKEFWVFAFENAWKSISLKLQETTSEKSRIGEVCTFSEFSKNIFLPIEVYEKEKRITALRGGFSIQFDKIEKIIFVPSVFNYKRLWTAYESDNGKFIVCFPFFEPKISLTYVKIDDIENEKENLLDAALIFRALGDVTRFAIVTIIAKEPKSSVELSKILSITKATVSHHVHILKEAGLIKEKHENGSVKLKLKKEVIEKLSSIAILKLYGN